MSGVQRLQLVRITHGVDAADHAILDLERQRLRPIGRRMIGIGMHLNEQPIRTCRQRRERHRGNVIAFAGAVARIDHDRQMRQLLRRRDHRQIERVAAMVGEGPRAAFAEHDLIIPAGEDVFRGHEQLFEGGGEPVAVAGGGDTVAVAINFSRSDLAMSVIALKSLSPK